MHYELGNQYEEVCKAFPEEMPMSRSGKITLALKIVREFVQPCGTANLHIFYVGAGVIICESKNADDFIKNYDEFTRSL